MYAVRHYDQGTHSVEDISWKDALSQAIAMLETLTHDDPATDAVYYIVDENGNIPLEIRKEGMKMREAVLWSDPVTTAAALLGWSQNELVDMKGRLAAAQDAADMLLAYIERLEAERELPNADE